MGLLDLGVLVALQRQPSSGRYFKLVALTLAVLLGLVVTCTLLVDGDLYFGAQFMALGALAQGLFLHAPALLLLCGWLLRREARRLALGSVCLGLLSLGVGAYAFWFEPTNLKLSRHRVISAKLEAPMRLVVLSDLQLERLGAHEKRAIGLALAQEPDVLLLPGDFIHSRPGEPYRALVQELNAYLREVGFGAKLGTIAVGGNVEREGWERIFSGLPVDCFPSSQSVEWGGVQFRALAFQDSGWSDLKLAGWEGFQVVVGHKPDFALGEIQADLLVAGHTHGGQVVLPFLGPPITLTQVPRDWASGRTEIAQGQTLIVSRGVGMERGYAPRLRFLCPPEIVVIDLLPVDTDALQGQLGKLSPGH